MILKRKAPQAKPVGLLRSLGAGLVAAVTAVTLVVGCLDRPVTPQKPHTSNVFVAEIRQTAVDKIDLVFMIDNSISMADKQAILAQAVPVLLNRLVTPACVDVNGNPTNATSQNGTCGGGASPEFPPIKDIHIGIVSSSLGAHGGQTCVDPTGDDHGQLVSKARADATLAMTWNQSGFLAWDPDAAMGRPRNQPAGETSAMNLTMNFTNMVTAVGQTGCGYEASLEAWYRFLIDPQPPTSVPAVTDPAANTQPVFDNNEATNPVLMQRKQFLRPDSLVAIIMLTDENDCSIRDEGQGWLVGEQNLGGSAFRMPRATSACEANPNDRCCTSCAAQSAGAGCPDSKTDAGCVLGSWAVQDDNLNLRCYDQKRRFGFDLLYPTSRYVNGLYDATVPSRDHDASGNVIMAQNALYTGTPPRDRSLVFLAGILGVPWQDVSTAESWPAGAPLKYLTYQQMVDQGRWSVILGSPGDATTAPTQPADKLMFETPKDRTTLFGPAPHPLLGAAAALSPTAAGNPGQPNIVNGRESNIADNSDLQYACIFPLPTAKNCGMGGDAACDCKMQDAGFNRPLCTGTTQPYAKAYPGIRELRVLEDFGQKGTQNSIVASICPKTLGNTGDASYGYNPAVAAIIDRLKEALRGKCLPRKLIAETDPSSPDVGKVPCAVVEANVPANGQCVCNDPQAKPGRSDASPDLQAAVYRQLADANYCGAAPLPLCNTYCLCEIQQFQGADLARCQTEATTPTNIYGYCYVDPLSTTVPATANAETQIVAACPASQKRLLRFTGDGVPAKGSIAMIACLGSTVNE